MSFRRICFTVLTATVLLAAGCGGEADTVAELEQRIAELESESATETTTTTVAPTTTEAPTTTTQASTTTTTALLQADWESLSAQDIHGWVREDGLEIPEWVGLAITSGCEGAVQGFSTMGQLLGKDSIRILEIGSDAEDGVVPVLDAATAFEEYGRTATLVGGMADQVIEMISDRQGILWIGRVGQAASRTGFSALSTSVFVFDSDSNQIDREAMGVWLPGFETGVMDLITSSALYDAGGVCSG